jgi:cytochrome c-type biogenesis protein CcmH/NrfG
MPARQTATATAREIITTVLRFICTVGPPFWVVRGCCGTPAGLRHERGQQLIKKPHPVNPGAAFCRKGRNYLAAGAASAGAAAGAASFLAAFFAFLAFFAFFAFFTGAFSAVAAGASAGAAGVASAAKTTPAKATATRAATMEDMIFFIWVIS